MQNEEQKNIGELALKNFFDLQTLNGKDLESIVALKEAYPYCHAFYLLAAKSAVGSLSYEKHLAEAAANVPSRNVLYEVIHKPDKFSTAHAVVEQEKDIEEDEVYEEITPHFVPDEIIVASEQVAELQIEVAENTDEELLIDENVEADNFIQTTITEAPYIETLGDEFLREEKEIEENKSNTETENLPVVRQDGNVFRYHEERLPYTFLWWLNKTRKQYENIRPYADYYLDRPVPTVKPVEKDELEHQIVENIFHQTSLEEVGRNTQTVPFELVTKQHHIIERFIKEEPHITVPRADKIDTENKAKKSSEDSNELVSETLARVYVEQMLYHKALDIYKKLSLKYPEKNAYFASQIKYLELKVN